MSLLSEKTANTADPERLFAQERDEILAGLSAAQKRIAPKYFYDKRGSELFDRICELPEYYPTRTEARIVADNAGDIAARVGPGAAFIEFGAGSNVKATALLDLLDSPVAYVPVEISGEYLHAQARAMKPRFPDLSIRPVVADFTKPFDLPRHPIEPKRNLIFFPGSTIGNFTPDDARSLLDVMRREAKPGGGLLIGVDLVKPRDIIRAAYNDAQGVTALFNLNVLTHLNDGIGASFDPALFRHEAIYDEQFDRIEMRLISKVARSVDVAGQSIDFSAGEHIVTEYSHKYTIERFAALTASAGWQLEQTWTDQRSLFSVHFLRVPGDTPA